MSFPRYDEVGGNLIVASKSLAMLGWSAPAALTARVAIERGLIGTVIAHGGTPPEFCRPSDLINLLYRGRKPLVPHLERCTRVYGKLSTIAHGGEVKLLDAVKLIEKAEQFVVDWRKEVAA